MAPTTRQATKTKVGEEVLDLVIPYIHNVDDRSSVSLVSRNFYEVEGITRPPPDFNQTHYPDIRITPWIEQLALEFRCSKELCIYRLVVHDEDLETLARTRGKDLRSLKIKKCKGKRCDLVTSISIEKHGFGKIEECYLSKLGDAFRYAFRLEHFGGYSCDAKSELVGFQFPPNIHSLSRMELPVTQYSSVLPLLNQIRKLKLVFACLDEDQQCLLFTRCTNLEVLYTIDGCGDRGLQVIGKFCKKLRKLTHYGLVTHVELISLAKGCTNLESLDVILGNISNEALECVGTHLKILGDFRMHLVKDDGTTGLLDNGIRAMLMGCRKLERLDISLRHGGLTDVGLAYIEKYGVNLRSLGLDCVENSNAD
ncbi:leucine-rich repeat, cysteine-containing subtype protein [Tanacetum coccineum]